MQNRIMGFLLAGALMASFVVPAGAKQEEVPAKTQAASAQALVDAGKKQALNTHKRVFVLFHASWCGWCKRLDALLDRDAFKKPFLAHYMLVHLDVQEHGAAAKLENEGGAKLLTDWGGEKSGLPFYVILDEKGKKLGDSNQMPNQQNIGYPGSKEEIAAFAHLLQMTTPRLTDKECASMTALLEANRPRD